LLEGIMPGQNSNSIRMTAVVAALLVVGVGIGAPSKVVRADDCVTAPNSPAPAGRRWGYRTDPATKRKCWQLFPSKRSAHEPVSPATPDVASADWRHQPNPVSDAELKQDEATCTKKGNEGPVGPGSPEFKFYLAFSACMHAAGYEPVAAQ
jgi:hypothetical protein